MMKKKSVFVSDKKSFLNLLLRGRHDNKWKKITKKNRRRRRRRVIDNDKKWNGKKERVCVSGIKKEIVVCSFLFLFHYLLLLLLLLLQLKIEKI